MIVRILYMLVALFPFFTGCSKEEMSTDWKPDLSESKPNPHQFQHPSVTPPQPVAPVSSGTDTNSVFRFSDLTFVIPGEWKQIEASSSMRLAEFRAQAASDVEIVAFHFGPSAGSIEANLSRWKDQFLKLESDREENLLGGKVRIADYSGTFKLAAAPMSPSFQEAPGYRMLASIIHSQSGPVFFKVTDSKEKIALIEKDFWAMMQSIGK
ncbi:MAG: hypothetical protein H3C47_03380 [Candidatus Cloacimonetes bacterium]|nr:hypothetical protein [Candidatus Cloacimonadota bacterium]